MQRRLMLNRIINKNNGLNNEPPIIRVKLGDMSGKIATSIPNMVLARGMSGNVMFVWNTKVKNVPGLDVFVGYAGKKYPEVLGLLSELNEYRDLYKHNQVHHETVLGFGDFNFASSDKNDGLSKCPYCGQFGKRQSACLHCGGTIQ